VVLVGRQRGSVPEPLVPLPLVPLPLVPLPLVPLPLGLEPLWPEEPPVPYMDPLPRSLPDDELPDDEPLVPLPVPLRSDPDEPIPEPLVPVAAPDGAAPLDPPEPPPIDGELPCCDRCEPP
jgi:signal-induced proliferation-associated 1 like protein 3